MFALKTVADDDDPFGLDVPCAVRDHCGLSIHDAAQGHVVWMGGGERGIATPISLVHKGACDTAHQQARGARLHWMSLDRYLLHLIENTQTDVAAVRTRLGFES